MHRWLTLNSFSVVKLRQLLSNNFALLQKAGLVPAFLFFVIPVVILVSLCQTLPACIIRFIIDEGIHVCSH